MSGPTAPLGERVALVPTRRVCRLLRRWRLRVRVEGLEHVPRAGPAIVAARHFHWAYDGAIFLSTLSRPSYYIIGLGWVRGRRRRALMTRLCGIVRWPVIFAAPEAGGATYRQLHQATREVIALLRAGNLFVLFPEGFATIDIAYTPKTGDRDFLPFEPGFVRLAELAERDGRTRVPIVPAGLEYERLPGRRWRVVLRFAPPHYLGEDVDRETLVREVEAEVRALSGLAAGE